MDSLLEIRLSTFSHSQTMRTLRLRRVSEFSPFVPRQPPMPKLEVFKAEQPKYAAECLDYQNLWKEAAWTS